MKTIEFFNEICTLEIQHYANDKNPAIQIYDQQGCPMAHATVNLPNVIPNTGQLFIKDYAENSGMAKAFFQAKLAIEVSRMDVGRDDKGISVMKIIDPELWAACYPQQVKTQEIEPS